MTKTPDPVNPVAISVTSIGKLFNQKNINIPKNNNVFLY